MCVSVFACACVHVCASCFREGGQEAKLDFPPCQQHVHTHTHTHTHSDTHTRVCVYVCVCVCTRACACGATSNTVCDWQHGLLSSSHRAMSLAENGRDIRRRGRRIGDEGLWDVLRVCVRVCVRVRLRMCLRVSERVFVCVCVCVCARARACRCHRHGGRHRSRDRVLRRGDELAVDGGAHVGVQHGD